MVDADEAGTQLHLCVPGPWDSSHDVGGGMEGATIPEPCFRWESRVLGLVLVVLRTWNIGGTGVIAISGFMS